MINDTLLSGALCLIVGFALGLAWNEFEEWRYRRDRARRMIELSGKPRIVSEINQPPPWTSTPIGREIQKHERKSA